MIKAQANLRRQTLRTFVTTSRTSIELPGPNATPSTSLPPVTPVVGEGEAKQSTISTRDAAAELRKLTGRATETYTAYGVTENLVKQCSAQADYQIPQALNNEEMPKTADGEDLGQGSGWWHIGERRSLFLQNSRTDFQTSDSPQRSPHGRR